MFPDGWPWSRAIVKDTPLELPTAAQRANDNLGIMVNIGNTSGNIILPWLLPLEDLYLQYYILL